MVCYEFLDILKSNIHKTTFFSSFLLNLIQLYQYSLFPLEFHFFFKY
jgi:hypothetical protein